MEAEKKAMGTEEKKDDVRHDGQATERHLENAGNGDRSSDEGNTAVGGDTPSRTASRPPGMLHRRTTRTVSLGRQPTRDRPERWMPKPDRYSPRDDVTLAVDWPQTKKWTIALVICAIQISMNLNTSVYANALTGITEEFHISEQAGRVGQSVFLITYAIGSLLWAPWSEELGRKWVMQLSLGLVNVFQLPAALAPNYGSMVVARTFGGLFSAGGSVTLGVIADLWEAEDQTAGVIAVVFASVLGAALGPIPGGALEQYAPWRWVFWFQLILGGIVQIAHFFLVPETRSVILLERAAKQRRKEGKHDEADKIDQLEEKPDLSFHHAMVIWWRPFEMFFREPIVFCLSALSGFSDALIFTFLEAYVLLYKQWGFKPAQIGAAYVPIVIGYIIVALTYIYPLKLHNRIRRQDPNRLSPESRLWWLLFWAPCLPIGLFGTAWTSFGPPKTHWIAPMIFSCLIGIANYAIYMSTIDYMIASYGPYSSSATAGNAFARDGIAGAATLYATPMFHAMGLQWGTTFLAFVAVLVVIPVYLFYVYGPTIRYKSKFAMSLAEERASHGDTEQQESAKKMRGEKV